MSRQRFCAYEVHPCADMPIVPGPVDRDWMDQSDQRFAYRCLPLTIANQAGWLIANPVDFTATWDGGTYQRNVRIQFGAASAPVVHPELGFTFIAHAAHSLSSSPGDENNPGDKRISSHFGSGVVTFTLPYLFRTPPGVNLWVKGPSNWLKDGAQALEGIVETDWLPATFTMNWKLTRPQYPVHFARGDPICMVVPVPRGFLESFDPVRVPLSSQPALEEQYDRWWHAREAFNAALRQKQAEAVRSGWQRDYTKGLMPDGSLFPEHQTRLLLKEFTCLDQLPSDDDVKGQLPVPPP